MVGDSQAIHAKLPGSENQLRNTTQPIKKAVFGMNMKVGKHRRLYREGHQYHITHLSLDKGCGLKTFGRGLENLTVDVPLLRARTEVSQDELLACKAQTLA